MTESVLVIKPNQDLEIRSKTNLTSEDIFKGHVHENDTNVYTILERSVFTLSKREGSFYDIRSMSGLINKIHLVDFPHGQYFLQIHGMNVATAKLENGQYVFNLDSDKRSHTLTSLIGATLTAYDEFVPDRHKYVNFSRVENIRILTPQPLETAMIVKLEGLFHNDYEWAHNIVPYTLYPNEMIFNHKNIARRMILTSEKEENVYIRMAGRVYGPIPTNSKGQIVEFEGFDIIKSLKSKYIPDNSKCMPFNRMGSIGIISSQEIEITVFSYETYTMDSLMPVFSM